MRRSVVEESYRDMLDEMDGGELFAHYSNADILESVDPTAYRCGLNDYSDSYPCQTCGKEFCVDAPEESDGVCDDCKAKENEEN